MCNDKTVQQTVKKQVLHKWIMLQSQIQTKKQTKKDLSANAKRKHVFNYQTNKAWRFLWNSWHGKELIPECQANCFLNEALTKD